MGRLTKFLVLVPLTAFGVVILGFGMYLTLCKNSNIPFDC